MAPKAGAKDGTNFRMRRLSVSDAAPPIEMDPSSPSPGSGVDKGKPRRQRRMSQSPEMGVIKPRNLLPFEPEVVGTYSCHGVEPGMKQGETHAKINQDRGAFVFPYGPEEDKTGKKVLHALFMVFDGHGSNGDKVSHYSMNNVQEKLEEHADLCTDPAKALFDVFVKVDADLKKDSSIDAELSGTTAVVVLCKFHLDDKGKPTRTATLWAANAGDSRAILASHDGKNGLKVFDLTEDQKPDTPQEARRIKKSGGFVSPPEEEWGGPARVWLDASMTLPGLAMARSIGDHLVSDIGVHAEPEVTSKNINFDDDAYMIMASDGVWEFVDSNAASKLVSNNIKSSATEAVTRLIEESASQWRREEGDYRDDITAICVRWKDLLDKYIKQEFP